ncbi:MAG: hotdog domain-containing protein [Arcobacteraceae bacterium]|nr:hotdog domain-containing protein [Arcobacteraceae bacterium]
MQLNTHLKLNNSLNGNVIELKKDYAKISLQTSDTMRCDDEGLVHGGFAFCAADFCAMASVNHPFVVLAKSEVKFLAPVKVGDVVIFEGNVASNDGRKQTVSVVGKVGDKDVFMGEFKTVILEKHILC